MNPVMGTLVAAAAAVMLGSGPLAAAEVPIAEEALRNLGVEFAAPASAGSGVRLEARAHVIVPPEAEYVISSSEAGLIRRLMVTAGQPAVRGQVLAEVQSPAFLTLQQEFLAAEQAARVAAAQLARDEQLHEEGIIAARRLEQARADAMAARARRDEHRQMLGIAGMREVEIDALAASGDLLEVLTLRSPIDGVVLDVMASVGESVGPAQAVFRIADLTSLWLDIHLPQEKAPQVAPGMRVQVGNAEGGQYATVLAVGGAVDRATQTVSVRAALEQGPTGLRPGQLVTVRFAEPDAQRESRETLTVPAAAVVRSDGVAYVFVRTAAGVEAREVAVAGTTGANVQVSNVGRGDSVAVSGVSALKALWLSTRPAAGE